MGNLCRLQMGRSAEKSNRGGEMLKSTCAGARSLSLSPLPLACVSVSAARDVSEC